MGPGSDEVDEIRQQIEESRANLGDAVGALSYKADVKNRGKEAFEDKEVVMEKVDELKGRLPSGGDAEGGIGETIKSKLPDAESVKSKLPDAAAVKSKLPGGGNGEPGGSIADKAPSKEDVKAKAQGAAGAAADHPIALAAGAAAAGLAAGLALPTTDLEREKLGPKAQSARAQAQSAAQDAFQQAKSVAQDVTASAAEAAKQVGQQQGGKLGEAAQKAADKTQEQVNSSS